LGSPLAPQRMPEQIRWNLVGFRFEFSFPAPPKLSDAARQVLLRASFLHFQELIYACPSNWSREHPDDLHTGVSVRRADK